MKRHCLVLPAQKGGSTPRTLIPVWTLLLRHISSSIGVARPFTNGVEWGWENVQTLWWVELDRLHSTTRAHPPLYVGLARAVSPANTKFRLTFLLTRLQEALYEDLAV